MLLTTLFALQSAHKGFDTRNVLAIHVPVVDYERPPEQIAKFYKEALRRIAELPGVAHVAVGTIVPWRDAGTFGPGFQFSVEGYARAVGEEDPRARYRTISPGFFAALKVPMLAGRDFDARDRFDAEKVVIISQSVARRMFPTGDALNRKLLFTDPVMKFITQDNPPRRIVGIVGDMDDENIVPGPAMSVYQPYEQGYFGGRLFVHATTDPYALVRPITRIIREVSPEQPVEQAATLEDVRAEVLAPNRLNALVFGGFAMVALTIAIVGVAGVLAFSVSARTREFGIRLAIGSEPRHLLTRVFGEGAIIAAIGIAVGVVAGLILARVVGGYIPDIRMPGVSTVLGAAAILVTAAILASFTPAARAARVDVDQRAAAGVTSWDGGHRALREELLRELAPQVLGAVIRRFGDFSAAEDAVQEALLAAAMQWPKDGVPDNPRGWLIQVAIRRMTDQIRTDSARRRREGIAVTQAELDQPSSPAADAGLLAAMAYGAANADGIDLSRVDDTLILLFMCCHPSLTPASATVLTLRAVGGLTTTEIAKAFMVPEATMAQRISRAKKTIKSSGVPFSLPTERERDERLAVVMHVLYLIFNEGYTSTAGESLHRVELSNEAIRLTRILYASDTSAEVAGLLALMLLTDARRAARVGPEGELIPLDEQDRGRWDRGAITEGIALLSGALPRGEIGPYQIQAAIAALHDEAARAEETDWAQILAFYGVLQRMSDNPMVALNHAIATAMVHGPDAGLTLLDGIEARGELTEHHRLPAVRGHLLEMAGERGAAVENYRMAASLTESVPEQRYLVARAERVAGRRGDG